MPGVQALAQRELETSVRIAVPDYIGVRDPAFTNGVGMIQYVSRYMRPRSGGSARRSAARKPNPSAASSAKPGFFERLKRMFSEFI
jgi:cell division protein FtsA